MSNEKYNGWTNYETWLVALWLDNDQGSQEYWQEQAREVLENNDCDKDAALSDLADAIQESHDEAQSEMVGVTGVFADLLTGALGRVEWREIARHYLDEIDVYSAGWNMPGYLPDSEPSLFLDAGDAREYIADEMQRHLDESGDFGNEKNIEVSEAAIDECRNGSGEYGATFANYHYFVSRV